MITQLPPPPGKARDALIRRFLAKVTPDDPSDPFSCLRWQAAKQINGYGKFSYMGCTELAHRVAFVLVNDRIPDELDHTCNNADCVNSAHLVETNHYDNLARSGGITALNAQKQFCPAGHEYIPENTYINGQRGRKCATCARARQRASEYSRGQLCGVCRVSVNNRSCYCKRHKRSGEGRRSKRRSR